MVNPREAVPRLIDGFDGGAMGSRAEAVDPPMSYFQGCQEYGSKMIRGLQLTPTIVKEWAPRRRLIGATSAPKSPMFCYQRLPGSICME